MKVIAVSGWAGCGKDTLAEYIIKNYNYERISLATPLKDAVSSIFNWPRDLIEGATPTSREWRELIDHWWSEKLNIKDFSPRKAMQILGTEVFRNSFHSDIWLLSLEKKIFSNPDKKYIITDCRFKNEINLIRKLNGMLVWVQRGNVPEWFDLALKYNSGDFSVENEFKKYNIHPSEYEWIGAKFDFIISNDSNIDSLYSKIKVMMDKIEK